MEKERVVDILKIKMDREDKIISLCQVISHWASKRGRAMVWQQQDEFEKYDRHTKKFINDLEIVIKDNGQGTINQTSQKT
jgi:chromosome condensin MukBEF complex kleisin-like MukF subunit